MTSVISAATNKAHHLASSILSSSPVKPGATIPQLKVKEEGSTQAKQFKLEGKNVIVGVPGAFTEPCSTQVPGFLELVGDFKKRGVKDVYIVSVNDAFVMQAWKQKLAPKGTEARFIADDEGNLVSALGLVLDATDTLGGPRAKRFVVVTQGDLVEKVAVEEDPNQVTVTDAKKILSFL